MGRLLILKAGYKNNEMESIFTIKNLYRAYKDSIKRKSNKNSAIEFSYALEKNLYDLLDELVNKTYTPQDFKCFVVKDPVIREVFCSQFRDRVVQHLLLNEIEPVFEPLFIYDSFACRKNKGTHMAIKRVQQGIQSVEDRYKLPAYYLQMDISGFFMSIDKKLLLKWIGDCLTKRYKKFNHNEKWLSEVLWLCEKIIWFNPVKHHIKTGDMSLFSKVPPHKSLFKNNSDEKGLPIGNLSSQFFANVYLNELDWYVKRVLKCKYYYRYVDDFVILHFDKNYLKETSKKIGEFLREKLLLNVNISKTHIQECEKGIDFLGYIIRKKYILVRRRVVNNLKAKIYSFQNNRNKNIDEIRRLNRSISSYSGHFKHSSCYKLEGKIMDQLWHNI